MSVFRVVYMNGKQVSQRTVEEVCRRCTRDPLYTLCIWCDDMLPEEEIEYVSI